MLSITQPLDWRRFCALLCCAIFATACFGQSTASSQAQRRIGEARLQEGLTVSVTFGTVRAFSENELVVRQASPTMRMVVDSTADVSERVEVELRNVHLDAELRVAAVSFLNSDNSAGCPVTTAIEVDCLAAQASIGEPCETSGQCAEGLRCAMQTCQPSDLFAACQAPDWRRLERQQTSLRFGVDVRPCEQIQLETFVPVASQQQSLRFAVIGPSFDHTLIAELGEDFRDADVEFVALLGDNVSSADEDGLDALERTLIDLGTPAIFVAGRRELTAENGEAFLRRFGPHDHIWDIRGVRFFSFYSAPGGLGPRGFERLKAFLLQLNEGVGVDGATSPLIGLTHTPPFDPSPLRDAGFRNDVEAARVMSLLLEQGVDQLYAGALGIGSEVVHSTEIVVTSARGTVVSPIREWLYVELRPGEPTEGDREVAGYSVIMERRRIL